MKTKWSEFEAITRRQDLTPLVKQDFNGIEVAVAEGARPADEHMDQDYWIVTYAVAMGETMDMVQVIRVPKWIVPKSGGLAFPSAQQTRIEMALEAAEQWVNTNKEVTRY